MGPSYTQMMAQMQKHTADFYTHLLQNNRTKSGFNTKSASACSTGAWASVTPTDRRGGCSRGDIIKGTTGAWLEEEEVKCQIKEVKGFVGR